MDISENYIDLFGDFCYNYSVIPGQYHKFIKRKAVFIMLGLLLYGTLRAAVGIGKAVDNYQMKNFTYKVDEQGRTHWLDRNCNHYINGEKVIATYDYANQKLVYAGVNTGKVYFDPELAQRQRMDEWSEKRKQNAIKIGMLAYEKYNHEWKKSITTEISTGRPIAKIIGNSDGTFWKYYAREDLPEYKGQCYLGSEHAIDEPVQITREEALALDIVGGTHFAYGLRRY